MDHLDAGDARAVIVRAPTRRVSVAGGVIVSVIVRMPVILGMIVIVGMIVIMIVIVIVIVIMLMRMLVPRRDLRFPGAGAPADSAHG